MSIREKYVAMQPSIAFFSMSENLHCQTCMLILCFFQESLLPASFCSVVVITFASHAKGPRFDTGQKHYSITGRQLPAFWCVFTSIETVETLALSLSISRNFCAESQIKLDVIWPVSSVGQSVVLITPRSRVRSPHWPNFCLFELFFYFVIKKTTLPGFEPGIFWSVVRRVIHCATRPAHV